MLVMRLLLMRLGVQASFIGALFVLVTLPVTFYEVAMHLEYFSRPALQIHVIRILWMVPVYAVDAWLALRFPVRLPELHPVHTCCTADRLRR